MDSEIKIDILLSTYNGERYLAELLESVINQSFTDWRLLIRDDGSHDKTFNILSEYCKRYPHKITLMLQQDGNLGPSLSFGKLMEFSTAQYVMFCDQDDVWLKDKIQLSFEKIVELEKKYGINKPLLVHTDSFFTDRDLHVISGSTQHHLGLDSPQAAKFGNMILRNAVIGNTVLINRALVELSCPIPENAFMHDWWVAIIASAFGAIHYISKPTVSYRRHDQNVCGLERTDLLVILWDFQKKFREYHDHQDHIMDQIKAFYGRLSSIAGNYPVLKDVLTASPLASLEKLGYWKRKFFLFSYYKNCIYRLKSLVDLVFYFKIYK